MKIVNSREMRGLEEMAESRGIPPSVLMENAGRASAQLIEQYYRPVSGKTIVLVGPGNNGGDGLVAARYLHDNNCEVAIVLGAPRKLPDLNWEKVLQRNIRIVEAWKNFSEVKKVLAVASIVVDALFGTGKARPIEGIYKEILGKLKTLKSSNPSIKIVALDLPSGLDADTGNSDLSTCPADLTVTMACPKKGFYSPQGTECIGIVKTVDIGIPDDLLKNINSELLTMELAKSLLPARPKVSHKGIFGKVMVVAGSTRYSGAAYLACCGAYRAGAGLVALASTKKVINLVGSKIAETIYFPLPESKDGYISSTAHTNLIKTFEGYTSLLIGPGMGKTLSTASFLQGLLSNPEISNMSAVLDADALNLIAADIPNWWDMVSSRAIITPHPAEFSRLSGISIGQIQQNRMDSACEFAVKWNKILVLKGPFTVIAEPERHIMVSPWANPVLATAGTGDVLAGIISAFLAQGLESYSAAALGVYVHGLAGELVRQKIGETGAIASDLLPEIPQAINNIRSSG